MHNGFAALYAEAAASAQRRVANLIKQLGNRTRTLVYGVPMWHSMEDDSVGNSGRGQQHVLSIRAKVCAYICAMVFCVVSSRTRGWDSYSRTVRSKVACVRSLLHLKSHLCDGRLCVFSVCDAWIHIEAVFCTGFVFVGFCMPSIRFP